MECKIRKAKIGIVFESGAEGGGEGKKKKRDFFSFSRFFFRSTSVVVFGRGNFFRVLLVPRLINMAPPQRDRQMFKAGSRVLVPYTDNKYYEAKVLRGGFDEERRREREGEGRR